MFKPFDPKKSIPDTEEEMLAFWRENDIFAKSKKEREGSERFVFYEGPPTANGRPGIHHVIARTFKDVICRYQTMKGKYVLRKAGWDTHGLPVELQVEKALGLKNKQDIETYGVAEFNQKCKESVWQYKEEWEKLTERMGYWINLEHPYITYDREYIESVWWGLRQVWDKNLIYQDYKVVPYCPRCGTALSLAEVAQGYKDVTETSVYVKFALIDEPNASILAWTTTPWTLPGNVALAVGPDIPYVKVKQNNELFYLAKDRLSILEGEYELVAELLGVDLVGKKYGPLFDFINLSKESGKEAYVVVAADFVTTDDGTGIVHTAVMYGEDDFELGKKSGLPFVHTVDERGMFNSLVTPWQDSFVKDAEPEIVQYLRDHQALYKTESTQHSYPFCWRCGTPLLYYARDSWFIRIDQPLRDRLVEHNKTIKWVPEHLRDGRFGNWLEGLRDWAISRNRYWGTPIPIWVCDKDKSHKVCIASVAEMAEKATQASQSTLNDPEFDLHKPFIDTVELTCECGGTMKRVPEVLDVWIDSGSMPFAQWHYPYGNREQFDTQFPADYISEGVDQTRGWFNSLHILSTIIFDKPAFQSAISPNLVLDENGQKMSKSKGNVVDPWAVINETGIDSLRFYFMAVNQVGDYKNFSTKAVSEYHRKVVMIWWNVVSFFLTYAGVDKWQPEEKGQPTILDRWILSRLNDTIANINDSLAGLDTFTASRDFQAFIDELSTWYLRRSRKRRDPAFYSTLHEVLVKSCQIAAPMMPFVGEAIYQSLRTSDMPASVHLTDYPEALEIDHELLESMMMVRDVVTLGHAARAESKIKVRQPLAKAVIVGSVVLPDGLGEILADELNVKAVTVSQDEPKGWHIASDAQYTIALDPVITPELKEEGIVRDLVRSLQDLRKKSGCRPGQLVTFTYHTESNELKEIIEKNNTVLTEETSARSITAAEGIESANRADLMIDNQPLQLGLANVE